MAYLNLDDFEDSRSRQRAMGVDLRTRNAITDPAGAVLAYAQTGGIMNPTRHELRAGAKLFRFGRSGLPFTSVAAGAWWIEQRAFEKLFGFAQAHGLSIAMAMRCLYLVPPEWSDAGMLIRARVRQNLLAWRGLGNTVVIPTETGGSVRLPHHNELASRRLHQLFIPGLTDAHRVAAALAVEQSYPLSPQAGMRGFLYL